MVPKTFFSLNPSKIMAKFMPFFHLFHISITFTPISIIALFLLFAHHIVIPCPPSYIPFVPLSLIPFECPSYPHAFSNTLEMAKNSLHLPELEGCFTWLFVSKNQ
jgi:hypothetical protein